jgi:pyruvate/2-oxoglutarate dehydrogenase complex dihydrolipoamide acyltransferase (E2) component
MEINMDNAMAARTQMNEVSPVKISFQDMLIKASAMALRKHPAVNSSWMGDFIRTYSHVHVGSAIALPEGLIVPVIRFADQKSLSQIASDAKELYEKARTKKILPQDFTGNTFTISNLGMMDIDEFTAIVNPPDSCILAVGRIKEVELKYFALVRNSLLIEKCLKFKLRKNQVLENTEIFKVDPKVLKKIIKDCYCKYVSSKENEELYKEISDLLGLYAYTKNKVHIKPYVIIDK